MQPFEEIIIKNWSSRFQCSVSTIKQNGTTLIPDEKYANQNMIALWHIGEHTFAFFDPSYSELLNGVMAQLPLNTSLSGANIQKVSGITLIASHDIDLIHYLLPSDLPNLTYPQFSYAVLMKWVVGTTWDQYVAENISISRNQGIILRKICVIYLITGHILVPVG